MTNWLMSPRILGLFVLCPSFVTLLVARLLEPDPSGMGTHLQLGLNPCSFWLWFNLPCPVCGMTTTFSHMAHFQFLEGFVNQPFGAFLFLVTVSAMFVSILDISTGKGLIQAWLKWIVQREKGFILLMLLGLLLSWGYKITMVMSF